jgi:hypothetical protein
MKVIVGVGAFGFAAGPYFSFTSAVGAFRNSDIGMLKRRQAGRSERGHRKLQFAHQ